ncbi:GNAT family N-acetyltransferase [Chachezhania sediminis]|uniref:GNAT family N-acetyltransferase n=1 Tax=Chachezhania sediminis TaxID=2599291 RepID=UPI00131C71D3|nr:GNAT family N-acetyltransferase [Chachezhania sediminis]
MLIRTPTLDELPALTALCRRSKGYWGYDEAFLDACRDELALRPEDFDHDFALAEVDGVLAGLALVETKGDEAELLSLFVDPSFIGKGVGARLLRWGIDVARAAGAARMMIQADPNAVPFYVAKGAVQVGEVPSGAMPGRSLPLMQLGLAQEA